ncbi:ABC transporter ATP-binding protein [Microbacterium sp.]|uniref:ABC transporter ATP-binding protein n=1 Tax=Microbacterium sp. TaxID=51671 RepID=UPI002D7A368E|nr:ABC transporter ATP-binding protein [Microbacterium sp.]HET6301982.1 ABC transporter ATP-binding protein [Microbacterium sp.]
MHDLTLAVGAGEVVALVGLNGAGKTTLLKLALGMLRPDSGTVEIGGVPVERLAPAAWRDVGHLVDGPTLYGELTVRQNLLLAARMRGAAASVVESSIADLALERFADRRASQLSLGNGQRAALAMALQHAPGVLVLDEPGNALDPSGVLMLRDRIVERKAAGAAVLVSSHHLDEVARIADRIVVMNRGRLIGELDPGSGELERALFDRVRRDDVALGVS